MSFLDNVKTIWKKESFWVATIGSGIVAAWPLMPTVLSNALFTAFPLLQAVGPLVWLGTFVIARSIPAKVDTPTPATPPKV
jgi:hypothetical protein